MKIYVDGVYTSRCTNIGKSRTLEKAGVFIIGQSHLATNLHNSLTKNETSLGFDDRDSFVGSLFNFNIWDYHQKADSIYRIYDDCELSSCGNAVRWSDLWQGIRGDLKIIWPAGFFRNSKLSNLIFGKKNTVFIIFRWLQLKPVHAAKV